MLVWLAAYPRSGSSYAIILFQRCFGLLARGIHQIPCDRQAEVAEVARASPQIEVWKTHHCPPNSNDKAVYLVRDGRVALASYRRYILDYHGKELDWPQIVRGRNFGSWNDHVLGWTERPNRMVLKFESLVLNPDLAAKRIGRFLALPVTGVVRARFPQLHLDDPRVFRTGDNGPGIEEVERNCSDLFWRINGEAMRRMGYGDRPSS
jgi:hypothetical protein